MNAGIGARPPYYSDNPAVKLNWPHDAEKNELQLFYPTGGPTHGGPVLSDGCWHHVILVFYGTDRDFGVAPRVDAAVDGKRETIERGQFSSGFSLNGKLCLGAAGLDISAPFRGRIDEFAIYDLSGLTEGQIENRIEDMARRHFAAAKFTPSGHETAVTEKAEDAASNSTSSSPDAKRKIYQTNGESKN